MAYAARAALARHRGEGLKQRLPRACCAQARPSCVADALATQRRPGRGWHACMHRGRGPRRGATVQQLVDPNACAGSRAIGDEHERVHLPFAKVDVHYFPVVPKEIVDASTSRKASTSRSEHLSLSHSNHAADAGAWLGGAGSLRGSVRLKTFPGQPAAASWLSRRVGSLFWRFRGGGELALSANRPVGQPAAASWLSFGDFGALSFGDFGAEKRAWRIQQSRQRRTGACDSRSWPSSRRICQRLR